VKKTLLVLALLITTAYPKDNQGICGAYNNMKHTKNTHSVILDKQSKYRVVKKQKGQYLVVIQDEQPAQRWVSEACIDSNDKKVEKPVQTKHTKKYKKKKSNKSSSKYKRATSKKERRNLLVVSWHNSFCQTHKSKKECKSDNNTESFIVLHGLWPQPRNNAYCNVPKKLVAKDKHHQWRDLPDMETSKQTMELMSKYMPGYVSALHKHEWIKHGTCYGKSHDDYYLEALTFTKQIDESKVGELFRNNIGKKITLKSIKDAYESEFGEDTGDSVVLKCKNGLITELWITLVGEGNNLGELTKGVVGIKGRCYKGLVDPKGY